MKQFLVDYHFHPNLSKNTLRAQKKCVQLWKRFDEVGLDVVIATEHVFKNPPRAFELLQTSRPESARTLIFPGIEALTKEGIDVIIFSQTEAIYDHQKIMVPKQLSLFEMIEYIRNHEELFGSLAHPFSVGHSGAAERLGIATAIEAIKELGGVEVSNSCFEGGKSFLDKTKLNKVFKRQRLWADWVSALPKRYYDMPAVTLLTGGSDAHNLAEIGSGMLIPVEDTNTINEVFQIISTNQSTEFKLAQRSETHRLHEAVYKAYTIVNESFIKAFRLYEGKVYQKDDQFSTYYGEAEKEFVMSSWRNSIKLLKPILNFLTYFGIKPVHMNALSVVSLVWAFIIVDTQPLKATSFMLLYAMSVVLAGALARYQKTESEAGAIRKIAVHYSLVLTAVLTIIWFEWAEPFWAAFYLGQYTIMLWLVITLNKIGEPIRLIIRSIYFLVLAIFIYTLTRYNIISPAIVVFSVYMVITNSWMFLKLLRASK